MHTYHRRWIDELQQDWDDPVLEGPSHPLLDPPPLAEPLFLRGVEDLVDWASGTPEVGAVDWLDVWHLAPGGEVTCQCESCSCSSLVGWAVDPTPLLQLRYGGLDRATCGDDWLIVESRSPRSGTCLPPCDADREAFERLVQELGGVGVTLLDAVVFDDDGHWWSMRELTTGSIEWPDRT